MPLTINTRIEMFFNTHAYNNIEFFREKLANRLRIKFWLDVGVGEDSKRLLSKAF